MTLFWTLVGKDDGTEMLMLNESCVQDLLFLVEKFKTEYAEFVSYFLQTQHLR